jgi:glutathione S-transferase
MASDGEVRVIGGWACPYAIRVFAALKLKGVEYEFLQEPAGRKSELLLKSNPVYKKIPVLLHHGAPPICESMIIIQYIDEVWASNGPVILPAEPYARAIERFWAQYVDDKVFFILFVPLLYFLQTSTIMSI